MADKKSRNRISFRLRKMDVDLMQAIAGLADSAVSDLARDGLRLILGIKTTKSVQVIERPITTQKAVERPTEKVERNGVKTFIGNGGIIRQQSAQPRG